MPLDWFRQIGKSQIAERGGLGDGFIDTASDLVRVRAGRLDAGQV
ncbi:hypothetical protein BIWAKO_05121 [Bosea sp. BIWAKO-01]|nr:hypothetical protein BIWAKO_05121 [Bosea sp. BIWAKO-01]